ncbi:MAG TPA: hypothetical protein VND93_22190 [Myxococcales bacterium]|nr:hypothetical protein [Myxococcales bacterium]
MAPRAEPASAAAPRPPLPAAVTRPASPAPEQPPAPAPSRADELDREQLRQALVDLLVDAARQEGLEV